MGDFTFDLDLCWAIRWAKVWYIFRQKVKWFPWAFRWVENFGLSLKFLLSEKTQRKSKSKSMV